MTLDPRTEAVYNIPYHLLKRSGNVCRSTRSVGKDFCMQRKLFWSFSSFNKIKWVKNILVVIEAIDGDVKKSALEAISYGAHIAATWSSENCVLIIGQTDKNFCLRAMWSSKVIQVSNTISVADSQAWTNCISEVASQHQASIIIMPQNSSSKSIAGRLSIKLNAGCMIGANSLPVIQGNSMTISRSAFAGKATAYLRSNAPVIITLAQGLVLLKMMEEMLS